MTKTLTLIGALFLGTLALAPQANAATASGKVTFVGTMSEVNANGALQMRFRFRLTNSTCTGATGTAPTRWIIVHSGLMAEPLAHNLANARSAYGTLMAAFLSGKSVQVDGIPSCNASQDQTINLWQSAIGIF
jgi:hypothetical protein